MKNIVATSVIGMLFATGCDEQPKAAEHREIPNGAFAVSQPSTGPARSERKLSDFPLKSGITKKEIVEAVGPPDGEAWGVDAYFYNLAGGERLSLWFDGQVLTSASVEAPDRKSSVTVFPPPDSPSGTR